MDPDTEYDGSVPGPDETVGGSDQDADDQDQDQEIEGGNDVRGRTGGPDEAGSTCAVSLPCRNSNVSICRNQRCDGRRDCPEGEDELGCTDIGTLLLFFFI